MRLERLLENLIKLKLAKEIEKEKPKDKTPKERMLEMYVSPTDDKDDGKTMPDILLDKIKVLSQKKIQKPIDQIAREKDTEISNKRAMLEVNKNG